MCDEKDIDIKLNSNRMISILTFNLIWTGRCHQDIPVHCRIWEDALLEWTDSETIIEIVTAKCLKMHALLPNGAMQTNKHHCTVKPKLCVINDLNVKKRLI